MAKYFQSKLNQIYFSNQNPIVGLLCPYTRNFTLGSLYTIKQPFASVFVSQ